MNKTIFHSVSRYLIAGFFFTAILGTLSHFFYQWSGENPVVSLFSPINESVWEHMKLVFFPILLWFLLMSPPMRKEYPCAGPALLAGNLIGTLLIPVLFYTYSGILGHSITFVDILIFFIAVFTAFCTGWKFKFSDRLCTIRTLLLVLTALAALSFFVFTFLPPDISLFKSP